MKARLIIPKSIHNLETSVLYVVRSDLLVPDGWEEVELMPYGATDIMIGAPRETLTASEIWAKQRISTEYARELAARLRTPHNLVNNASECHSNLSGASIALRNILEELEEQAK